MGSTASREEGTTYLLFEKGVTKLYETVAVVKFDLAWLTQGHDLDQLLATPATVNRPLGRR